jgi:hypothetical protein
MKQQVSTDLHARVMRQEKATIPSHEPMTFTLPILHQPMNETAMQSGVDIY